MFMYNLENFFPLLLRNQVKKDELFGYVVTYEHLNTVIFEMEIIGE